MEASFKAFVEKPENRQYVEAYQRKEARKALSQAHHQQSLAFQNKVLASTSTAQRNIAPFLKNRVLRRIIQFFTNDTDGDFAKWANNPQVLTMLADAKQLLDGGYVTAEDMERCLLAQLQDPQPGAHPELARGAQPTVRLATDQLVGALNEHLTERRRGNDHYKAGQHEQALVCYERAKSIVELVNALSAADALEVDRNKVAVYLNIAAVHLAVQHHQAAARMCRKALELQPQNVKALVRRSKAYMGRHELQAAEKDLIQAAELDPHHEGLEAAQRLLKKQMFLSSR
ncbi:hypothetical protein WJX72_001445 [[Myrmecia] bisecta]|uniref:peptidylprolyl isomerase n=1 Tax=[Myrmecia] bisecta TaxID=41462 RepID=A0AAW1PJ87_9CHLO